MKANSHFRITSPGKLSSNISPSLCCNLLSVCTYNLITGTYLSRNSATLGPINFHASYRWCWDLTHESSLFISVSIFNLYHSISFS
eukprot:UN2283